MNKEIITRFFFTLKNHFGCMMVLLSLFDDKIINFGIILCNNIEITHI